MCKEIIAERGLLNYDSIGEARNSLLYYGCSGQGAAD